MRFVLRLVDILRWRVMIAMYYLFCKDGLRIPLMSLEYVCWDLRLFVGVGPYHVTFPFVFSTFPMPLSVFFSFFFCFLLDITWYPVARLLLVYEMPQKRRLIPHP